MTAIDTTPTQTVAAQSDDTSVSLDTRILIGVLLFIAAWAGSVVTWGIPGLYIPALMLVPLIWIALIIISRG